MKIGKSWRHLVRDTQEEEEEKDKNKDQNGLQFGDKIRGLSNCSG